MPVKCSLLQAGMRWHPVLCPETGICVGDIPRPGIWIQQEPQAVYFPQVTMMVNRVIRVDCLACFGRGRWAVLEIDGPAHVARWDESRDSAMQMPVWRICIAEAQSPKILQLTSARFGDAFGKR